MAFEFKTYMLECAVKLKEIRHSEEKKKFFRISGLGHLDELLSNLSKAQFPALVIEENHDGTIGDRSISNNYMDTPYFVFYVVDHAPFDDHDARERIKLECKKTGLKILSRMLRHKIRGERGLMFLQFQSIPYQTIGPIGDNCYGTMFSFTVSDTANVVFNPDDWDA